MTNDNDQSVPISYRDVFHKAGRVADRKLHPHECIQLTRLAKKFGIENVYSAFNFIEAVEGQFYNQLVNYLVAHKPQEIKDFKIDDITSKFNRNNTRENT